MPLMLAVDSECLVLINTMGLLDWIKIRRFLNEIGSLIAFFLLGLYLSQVYYYCSTFHMHFREAVLIFKPSVLLL